MDIAAEISAELDGEWLPRIYKEKIRTQRTRSIELDIPERENRAEIQYTLLGIELKVGKRRFGSPDLATARYMRVFARLGCREFAVPYNITMVSAAADDLETSWHRTLLLAAESDTRKTFEEQCIIAFKTYSGNAPPNSRDRTRQPGTPVRSRYPAAPEAMAQRFARLCGRAD